jgi:hypothetical protein
VDEAARLAHRSRVVAWLNAERPDEAARALGEAERAGVSFPDLRKALRIELEGSR